MISVLTAHTCNIVCQQLDLKNPYSTLKDNVSFEAHKQRSKLFNFEVIKVDIIQAQRLIAIRKPIPDPISRIFVPVMAFENEVHRLANVKDNNFNRIEKEQQNEVTQRQIGAWNPQMAILPVMEIGDEIPRLENAKVEHFNGIGNKVKQSDQVLQRLTADRKTKPGPIRSVVLPIEEDKPDVKDNTRIHKSNRNAGKLVCVGGPVCNDWPLPCNFYCNHCLTAADIIPDRKWAFS